MEDSSESKRKSRQNSKKSTQTENQEHGENYKPPKKKYHLTEFRPLFGPHRVIMVGLTDEVHSYPAFLHAMRNSDESDEIVLATGVKRIFHTAYIHPDNQEELMSEKNRIDRFNQEEESKAMAFLDRFKQQCKEYNRRCTTKVFEYGPQSVGEALCQTGISMNAEQLVIGSRHLGIVEKYLLGSVSHQLLDKCPLSLIIARNQFRPLHF